jgi:hypothetical protein
MPRSKFPTPKMPKAPGAGRGGGGGGRGGARGGDGASQLPTNARGGIRGQRGGGAFGKGGAHNMDGHPVGPGGAMTESDIFGGFSYYSEADGKTYHGQEAMDAYERDHPGEGGPHDGITGESGMYYGDSQWHPSEGGAGAGAGAGDQQGSRWGGGRGWSA